MPVYEDPVDARLLDPSTLRDWTAAVVRSIGTPPDIADDVAEVLLASDRRAIASHGTARLPQYVSLVEAGVMDPAARPVIVRERPALVLMSAQNGWGHHAAASRWTSPSSGPGKRVRRRSSSAGRTTTASRAGTPSEWQHRALHRCQPHQLLTTRRADAVPGGTAGYQPHRRGSASRTVRYALPGHGDVHGAAWQDRGRRTPRVDPAGRLGDRRGGLPCDDARRRARRCAPAPRRHRGDGGLQRLRPVAGRGAAHRYPGRLRFRPQRHLAVLHRRVGGQRPGVPGPRSAGDRR